MTWDPAQYLAFAGHRLRPAMDLLARIPVDAPTTVTDLGCGAGNATKMLAERWPGATVTGVDSSAEMLARAREESPDIEWIEADVGAWKPDAPVDVLFTNATLHWLGDHEALFPRLAGYVAPGGAFAVQMPANFREPSHTLVHDAARAGPWRETLEPMLQDTPTGTPDFYYDLLAPRAKSLDIWQIEYLQALTGDNPVVEFTKGTWLRPFLDALEEPQRSEFEADYRDRIRAAYPERAGGITLFPFRRLFIVAVF
jgi:trans-aconitate 2-methyltransferase